MESGNQLKVGKKMLYNEKRDRKKIVKGCSVANTQNKRFVSASVWL